MTFHKLCTYPLSSQLVCGLLFVAGYFCEYRSFKTIEKCFIDLNSRPEV